MNIKKQKTNKKAEVGFNVIVLLIIGLVLLFILILIAAKSKSGFSGLFSKISDIFG